MYRTYEPLRKWFVAVYLVAIDKRGVCASSLPRAAREVGVGLLHARPHSSRRRCHILLAVWRYFFQFVTSWSSHSWIRGLYGSSFEGLDMTALGGSGEHPICHSDYAEENAKPQFSASSQIGGLAA